MRIIFCCSRTFSLNLINPIVSKIHIGTDASGNNWPQIYALGYFAVNVILAKSSNTYDLYSCEIKFASNVFYFWFQKPIILWMNHFGLRKVRPVSTFLITIVEFSLLKKNECFLYFYILKPEHTFFLRSLLFILMLLTIILYII